MTDTKPPAGGKLRPTVITLRPGASSSLKEITLIGPPRGRGRPQEITLLAPANKYLSVFEPQPCVDPLSYPIQSAGVPDSALLLNSKKIPRPPNAFMIFANDWRKQLAQQYPSDSNKSISVRLGQLWKNMNKGSKEIYYQRSRQAGQDHKQKYPGYVYNPKEARMRKALREQSRGTRSTGGAPTRWTKHALTMNQHRQPLVTPVLLSQHQHCPDSSKGMLDEQVDRDNNMLQSYPDYLDLPYNIPSNDYPLDNQSWYPSYLQPGAQSDAPYMGRASENKLSVDWSTTYNSEQGNFIRASPQSSPYSIQNHQEVNTLLLNGDRSQPEQTTPCENSCLVAEHKPIVDPTSDSNNATKDPEQQVKELLASAKVICEGSPVLNGKLDDSNSTRLPGFHQAFGSTEIGRFSQPDGFFEAAVAAENERKYSPKEPEFSGISFSPGSSTWTSSYFSYTESCKPEPDLFGFQDEEVPCNYIIPDSQFNEPNHLYTMEDHYDPSQQVMVDSLVKQEQDPICTEEFESQDLSAVTNIGKPPIIISQNDNCCVVLESSAMDNGVKEYFSL
uniref:Sex-determining region Y protein n=1 Tax=Graphocephala atropunctata TaxID=36148 RepID=A0A1B6LYR3_9HEMI